MAYFNVGRRAFVVGGLPSTDLDCSAARHGRTDRPTAHMSFFTNLRAERLIAEIRELPSATKPR